MTTAATGKPRRGEQGVSTPSDIVVERLDGALMSVAHFFSGRTVGDYMSKLGLPESQRTLFRALRVVRDRAQPVSIRDVQQALGLSHPATSRLIDRCVGEGFVVRKESAVDRRHAILTLTEAGRRAARDVEQARRAVVAAVVSGWSPDDLAILVGDLERLGRDLGRIRENPPSPPDLR